MEKLNKAEWAAIDYLVSHRTTDTNVGISQPISTRTFNQLRKLGLALWSNEKGKVASLTTCGETVWNQRHATKK